jgi:hypothetical protein
LRLELLLHGNLNPSYSEWQLFVCFVSGNWAVCQRSVIDGKASEIREIWVSSRFNHLAYLLEPFLPSDWLLIKYYELLNGLLRIEIFVTAGFYYNRPRHQYQI